MSAYAIAVNENNLNAIASEAGTNFDLEYARAWLIEHGSGYFLRDEGSPFDCQFFEEIVLLEMYVFECEHDGALFRRVVKL
jgi:hypothetical protein